MSSTVSIAVTGIYKYLCLETAIFYTSILITKHFTNCFFVNLSRKQPKLKVKSVILGHRTHQW